MNDDINYCDYNAENNDGCGSTSRCYTNIGSYSSSKTEFDSRLASGDWCRHGFKIRLIQNSSIGNINTSYKNINNPPTRDQMIATVANWIDPDAEAWREDTSHTWHYKGIYVAVSGDTVEAWRSENGHSCGDDVYISDAFWSGSRWVMTFCTIIDLFEMYIYCTDYLIPDNTEKTDLGIYTPSDGWEWCSDIGGELCRICSFCELEVSYKISDNGV